MNKLDYLIECWLIMDDKNLTKKEKLKKIKERGLKKYEWL